MSSEEQTQEMAGKQKKPGKHKTVKPTDMDAVVDDELNPENISKDLVGTSGESTVLQPGSEGTDTPTVQRKKVRLSDRKKGEKPGKQAALGFQVDRRPSVKIMESVDCEEGTRVLKKSGTESRKRKKSSPKLGSDSQGSEDEDGDGDDNELGESVVLDIKSDTNQRKRRKIGQDRSTVLDVQNDRSSSKKVRETANDQVPAVSERGSVDEDSSAIAVASGQMMINGKGSDKEDEEEQGENSDENDEDEEEEEVMEDVNEDEVQTNDGEEEEDMVDDDDKDDDDDDDIEDSDDEQKNFTNVKKKAQKIGGQEPILRHFIDRGGNLKSGSSVKETKTTRSPTKPSLFSTDPTGHYFVDRGGQRGQDDFSAIQVIETSNIHTVSSEEQGINVEETMEKKKKRGSLSSIKKTPALKSATSRVDSKADGDGSEDSEESEKIVLGDTPTHNASLIEEEVGKKLSEIRQSLGKGSMSPDISLPRRTSQRKLRSESETSNELKPSSHRRSRGESEKSSTSSSRQRAQPESEKIGRSKATRSQKLENEEPKSPKDAREEGSSHLSPSKNLTQISQTPVSRAKGKQEVESVLSHWLRKPPSHSVTEPSKSEQTSQLEKEEDVASAEPRNSSSRKRQDSSTFTGKTLSGKRSSSPEKVKSPKTFGGGMANGAVEKEASVTEKLSPSPVKRRTRSAKRAASGLATPSGASELEESGGKDALLARSYNLRTPVKARGKHEAASAEETKQKEIVETKQREIVETEQRETVETEQREIVETEQRETMDIVQNAGQDSLKGKSSSRRKSVEPKRRSPVSARVTRRMSLRAAKS